MQVRNLMRSPAVTIDPNQSLQHAAQVMQEHDIGSVVVEQGGQVAGLLTERFQRLREDERRNRNQFLAVLRDLDPADPAEEQRARQSRDQRP